MSENRSPTVWIVEDEVEIGEIFADILAFEGFSVRVCLSAKQASPVAGDLVILDLCGTRASEFRDPQGDDFHLIRISGDDGNSPDLIKPFRAEELVDLVRSKLSLAFP